jgi:hypothetical protein
MRSNIPSILCVFFVLAGFALAHAVSAEHLAQFIAGIEILRAAPDLDERGRAKKYVQLVEITGIDAETAARMIRRYRNRPDDWGKVLSRVRELLDEMRRETGSDGSGG